MSPRTWAAALCAAACVVSPALAQPLPIASSSAPITLAVPFLPQSEALCGGAAAAMVMRYWGAQDVFADAFAPLVDRSAGGIRQSALVNALEGRRWTAVAGPGDAAQLAQELGRGRPVIALIEDRPGRFHYVVVVSSAAGKIVLHDPARAPSRVLHFDAFDKAWQKSDRWMLILLPPSPTTPASPEKKGTGRFSESEAEKKGTGRFSDSEAEKKGTGRFSDSEAEKKGTGRFSDSEAEKKGTGRFSESEAEKKGTGRFSDSETEEKGTGRFSEACAGTVEEGVGLARRGDNAAARRALEAAARSCPAAGAPWRELAGLDALEENWTAAAEHARRAVATDPEDAHAWRLLATAEYLRHDDLAALSAWNRLGEPRADLVDIKGLEHTRYMVIADAIGVRPREIITPGALRLARRRVLAVPAVAAARVSFQPGENGRAQIDAALIERDQAPVSYASWIGIGLRAATDREIATSFSNVSGGGDVVTVSWRWWEHRPRVAAAYAAPGPLGIWRLDASRETQTFGATAFEETRTRAGAEISNWIDQRIRLRAGAALENWSDRPRTAAISAHVEVWPVVDRLALEAGGGTWRGAGVPFGAANAALRWRSGAASTGTVWRGDAGYSGVTASAPASIWPGADSGVARDALLRAHPLLDDGIIRGGVFGRRLAFGALEVQHWLKPGKRPIRLAPAAFVDIARAWRGLATTTRRTQVDAGAGVRFSLLGMGVLRVDVARGLRDGRTVLSVGWQR